MFLFILALKTCKICMHIHNIISAKTDCCVKKFWGKKKIEFHINPKFWGL